MKSFQDYLRIARINWALWGVIALLAAYYGILWSQLHEPSPVPIRAAAPPEWPVFDQPPAELWSVFQRAGAGPASGAGPLAQRFRLAGTFFAYAEESAGGAGAVCQAILDDLARKEQFLVREGDSIEDIEVVRIHRERVVLRTGGREEELALSFISPDQIQPVYAATPAVAPRGSFDGEGIETNRFGKRVAENRWVMQRDNLTTYYQELMDEPERMAAIFLSMKPDYQKGSIKGYFLDVEGEGDFFKDAGLKPGDVVRKVNSMNMTSQARAEYFIGEFLKDRLSAVVLDIEREGKPEKLIYMIR